MVLDIEIRMKMVLRATCLVLYTEDQFFHNSIFHNYSPFPIPFIISNDHLSFPRDMKLKVPSVRSTLIFRQEYFVGDVL
jgi:hypothetical protein